MEFPIWSILPFILLLLSIAVIPLITPHWWARNTNKLFLSFVASIPVLTIVVPSAPDLLLDSIKDYISFIVLLGALFVISGGIYIKG